MKNKVIQCVACNEYFLFNVEEYNLYRPIQKMYGDVELIGGNNTVLCRSCHKDDLISAIVDINNESAREIGFEFIESNIEQMAGAEFLDTIVGLFKYRISLN